MYVCVSVCVLKEIRGQFEGDSFLLPPGSSNLESYSGPQAFVASVFCLFVFLSVKPSEPALAFCFVLLFETDLLCIPLVWLRLVFNLSSCLCYLNG